MDMKTTYPSRWWMPDDFDNIGKKFKIGNVRMEQVGAGFRPCMFFYGVEKGLVVWEATAKLLSNVLKSSESNDWVGREIVIYSFDGTNQQGAPVKRLGIRLPEGGVGGVAVPAASPHQPPQIVRDEMNDDIPF